MPDTMHRNDVADVLRRARKLIERPEDWIQGRGKYQERRCAGYALVAATDGQNMAAFSEVCTAFRRAIGTDEIANWNDAPERTHAEILAAFDKAIVGATP